MTLDAAHFTALLLALAAPPAIAALGTRKGSGLGIHLVAQALLVAVTVAALWITLGPLGVTPDTLGFGLPDWRTAIWGLGIAAFFIVALGPVLMRLPGWLGLAGFEDTLASLARLPLWYLVLTVIIGGIAEELLYRGVAFSLLTTNGMTPALAGLLVVLAFALAHLPMWGAGPALTTAISGACLMLFFLWHGDLVANMIGHILTDFAGIVLGTRRRDAP